MTIFGKVCRYPIQKDSDALLVHIIYEILKVFRCAKAAGRCIVSGDLVAPGAIERILRNGHQFNMRKTQVLDIGSQLMCQFTIGQVASFFRIALYTPFRSMSPGAGMYLVDRNRRTHLLEMWPLLYPLLIMPLVLVYIGHYTGGQRSQFGSKTIGVSFIHGIVIETRIDCIFVQGTD